MKRAFSFYFPASPVARRRQLLLAQSPLWLAQAEPSGEKERQRARAARTALRAQSKRDKAKQKEKRIGKSEKSTSFKNSKGKNFKPMQQALALFRGLSQARRRLIPQRSRLVCVRAVPVARATRRNWGSSRVEWPSTTTRATAAVAAASRSSSTSSTSSSMLPLPLCELPATEQVPGSDLLAWRSWAKELVESLGLRGLSADGGPDRRELLVRFCFCFLSFFPSSYSSCRLSLTFSSHRPQ